MIMMAESDSEMVNALRRSNRDYRMRIERMELDRERFVDHIADLRVQHAREVDQMTMQIRDLHQLVARLEVTISTWGPL